MINELILQGFKRHRGNTKLPLAPITLLLGSNSAGKSSVFQSLLVLKQTLESGAAGITSLVTDGARAELGAFDNVVNGGLEGAARAVRIGVSCRDVSPQGQDIEWGAWLGYGNPDSPTPVDGTPPSNKNELQQLRLRYGDWELSSAEWPWREAGDPNDLSPRVRLRVEDLSHRGVNILPTRRPPPEPGEGESESEGVDREEPTGGLHIDVANGAYAWAADLPYRAPQDPQVLTALVRLETLMRDLRHIGPTRRAGRRSYARSRTAIPEVGASGEHLINLLLTDGSEVNKILGRLKISYQVETALLHTLSEQWDIRLRDGQRPTWPLVGIGDVGFGVSQVLPIVAEWSRILRERRPDRPQTLLIEQPELHLHPRLQLRLVQELSTVARQARKAAGDTSGPSGCDVQVLLETHSETVVLAVQQLVRSGKLSRADVSILAFEIDTDGRPSITAIPLGQDGAFLAAWPRGFFEENDDLRFETCDDATA